MQLHMENVKMVGETALVKVHVFQLYFSMNGDFSVKWKMIILLFQTAKLSLGVIKQPHLFVE